MLYFKRVFLKSSEDISEYQRNISTNRCRKTESKTERKMKIRKRHRYFPLGGKYQDVREVRVQVGFPFLSCAKGGWIASW